jgi:hypothetical protein
MLGTTDNSRIQPQIGDYYVNRSDVPNAADIRYVFRELTSWF